MGASRKSVGLPLKTMPVGLPGAGWLGAFGTVTTSGLIVTGVVDASYSVDLPVALSETHQGVDGP
jgi:hypothetical protein